MSGTGIQGGRALMLGHDLGALFRAAHDGFTSLGGRLLASDFEDFLQTLDLARGFFLMLQERSLEALVPCGLNHFWKSRKDILLGEINILEGAMKKVGESLGFFSHGNFSIKKPPLLQGSIKVAGR